MKACKKCHLIIDEEELQADNLRCPNCNSTDLSADYSGIVIILDPEKSTIAERLNVTRSGKYALRVR